MHEKIVKAAKKDRRSVAFIMREAAALFLDRVSDTQKKAAKK
jgi:hypothetical protein